MGPTVLPPISIKAEEIFEYSSALGNLTITNSMLQTVLVVLGIALFFFLATRKMNLVPRGSKISPSPLLSFCWGSPKAPLASVSDAASSP